MKLSSTFSILFTTCILLTLTACGGGNTIKETLGLGRKAPDEFRVVSRPPLSVPPQFNLQPPSARAESPTMIPADKQAKSIITGDSTEIKYSNVNTSVTPVKSKTLDSTTAGRSQFLKNIGTDKADPNVRNQLIQEKVEYQEKEENSSWWNSFSLTSNKKATVVDAKEEAKRIKKNKAENKPITEGKTPEIKEKDRGIIGSIFGW